MALAVDTLVPTMEGNYVDLPVLANAVIYEGAAIMLDGSGFATPLSGQTEKFVGFADRAVTGTGTSGGVRVRVRCDEHVRRLVVTGQSQANVGTVVYASDDGTFTFTAAATNTMIGRCVAYDGTYCDVRVLPYDRLGPHVHPAAGANPTQAEWAALIDALVKAGVLNYTT